eukprot:TRINITY_DN15101_c0_g1_i1.p1 TRINITY_DN15101_c0_g1~~TRINITY_DN15101_c0_g1_i1.p1  ORF type:complete len:451 (+),score=102.98 TRINITY_DN15101_c0_g1_i1:84-1355(+)
MANPFARFRNPAAPAAAAAPPEQQVAPSAAPKQATPLPKRRRRAAEHCGEDGRVVVETLCMQCRRAGTASRQMTLGDSASWNRPAPGKISPAPAGVQPASDAASPPAATDPAAPAEGSGCSEEDEDCPELFAGSEDGCGDDAPPAASAASGAPDGELRCDRCRRALSGGVGGIHGALSAVPAAARRRCPYLLRLQGYRRVAKNQGVPWELREAEAVRLMRGRCVLCNVPPDPSRGHGLTRLRAEGSGRRWGPGCMGGYTAANVAPCCSVCNHIKGSHTVQAIREICRHIATHQRLGEFGRFPQRFRDNISRKCRSGYLSDSKTFSLSNEQFNELVAQPCYYCGKAPRKGADPKDCHYNGLDRLDSSVRVYSEGTCVACCGTCNIAKWRYPVARFLDKVAEVAAHAVSEGVGAAGSEAEGPDIE